MKMVFRVSKLIRFALMFIGGVIAIVLIASTLIAVALGGDFWFTLILCMFFGGVAVLYVGAQVGAGFSERAIHTAAFWTGGHHSKYYEHVHKERFKRRDDQFGFMVLMATSGIILIVLALVLGLQ